MSVTQQDNYLDMQHFAISATVVPTGNKVFGLTVPSFNHFGHSGANINQLSRTYSAFL
jgi:hypothetical protein